MWVASRRVTREAGPDCAHVFGRVSVLAADDEHDPDSDHDAPVFSAFTGKFVARSGPAAASSADVSLTGDVADAGSALVKRNQETTLAQFHSPALDFLNSREFQGLDPSAENVAVTKAVPGWFGTASGYVAADAGGSGGEHSSDSSDEDDEDDEDDDGDDVAAASGGAGSGAGAGAVAQEE